MKTSVRGTDQKKDAAGKDGPSKTAKPARASLTGTKTSVPAASAATVTVRRASKDGTTKTASVTAASKAATSPTKSVRSDSSARSLKAPGSPASPAARPAASGSKTGLGARPASREATAKATISPAAPAAGKAPAKAPVANGQPPAAAPARPAGAAAGEARRNADAAAVPAEVVKPDNQLQLTETELKEDIAKMLTTAVPDASKASVRYLYREHAWRPELPVPTDSIMMHHSSDGWLIHKTADETRRTERVRTQQAAAAAAAVAASLAASRNAGDASEEAQVSTADAPAAPAHAETRVAGTDTEEQQVLRNQFNFSERGAQTGAQPPRDRGTSTEPLPVTTVGGSTSHWVVYDAYVADQDRQRSQEEANKAKSGASKSAAAAAPRPTETPRDTLDAATGMQTEEQDANVLHTPAMGSAAKVLERMSSQVSQLEIAMDFKYWDDIADSFRQDEGTLLPLWKFQTERARRKQVTAIAWNPEYHDMFAVGYGSFDFQKQGGGLLACFTLKNPGHPDFHVHLPAGIMGLDWHPQHTSLLAVGCYDGSVKVFDVRVRRATPLYSSIPGTGQHRGPVWGVRWFDAETAKARVFVSLSADGRLVMWSLVKDTLQHQDMMQLLPEGSSKPELGRPILSAGLCFDFHKAMDHLFLVGTEEGVIRKCSTAYSAEYLASFLGHAMATYAVRWNGKHPRAFLSASADWTVKLWDDAVPQAIMTFDLGCPVGDVAWAPFSSTVFAAATEDGKVHVFDLSQNTSESLCEQLVVQAANLTRISFNPHYPVLLVGDNKGFLTSFKLSPNLRKPAPPPKNKGAPAAAASAPSGAPAVTLTPEQAAAAAAAAHEAARLDAIIDIALKGRVGQAEQ